MMRRRPLLLTAVIGGLAAASAGGYLALRAGPMRRSGADTEDVCIVAPTFAYDPASGMAPTAAREVPAEARCPVCGMYPARQRRWAAQVIFADGHAQFLDSPLSLFHYLQKVGRYTPGRSADQIAAAYVSDQDSGHWIAVDQAVYVHGSRLPGPMRAGNLPAFASDASARAFIARQGGAVMTAAALRRELPAQLQQLAPHTH